MTDKIPTLYILMRTDLPSMNAGKAMAQASHASNAFIHHCFFNKSTSSPELQAKVKPWTQETDQGFGTCIVLGVTLKELNTVISIAPSLGFEAGNVLDPTYPYIVDSEISNLISLVANAEPPIPIGNGNMLHLRKEITCAWVFVEDKDDPIAKALLGNFKLHP